MVRWGTRGKVSIKRTLYRTFYLLFNLMNLKKSDYSQYGSITLLKITAL